MNHRASHTLRIKVCGMRDPGNIREVALLQPEFMGFIFYPDSPRYVNVELPPTPPYIKRTGVFVNASEEEVLQTVKSQQLHAVQLHGNEDVDYLKSLRQKAAEDRLLLTFIKAIPVRDSSDLNGLDAFNGLADLFVFDTKGVHPGGNGLTFDWKVLEDYYGSTPFLLSGGIGPEHIEALVHFFSSPASEMCVGIDLNSKFESAPAFKNINILQDFLIGLQHSLKKELL